MEYKIEQSENGHQWFVKRPHDGSSLKIEKVFYSQHRCEEYVRINTAIDSAVA
jgi:hypothetical protein